MKLYTNFTLNKRHKFSLSGSLNIARLQSNVYSTYMYSTEDKLKILAVEVLTNLLDKSDLKWNVSYFHQDQQLQ